MDSFWRFLDRIIRADVLVLLTIGIVVAAVILLNR